jgi:opacity protein-like surface antigen
VRPHKNLGFELGYFRMLEESKNVASGATIGANTITTAAFRTDLETQGITLDVLGYAPIHEKFELIGTAGATWTTADITVDIPGIGSTSDDDSEFGFRIGGGAQYMLTEQLNLRGLARYQTADFDGLADNVITYTLGLNYSF